jgi:serine/threonine protein kinase
MELADNQNTARTGVTSWGRPLRNETDLYLYRPRTLHSDLIANHAHLNTIEIILKVAGGLKVIHDEGLVHRDIKPTNIVYVDNEPKLADPGLIAQAGSLTVVGTFSYVAPEITFGQPAT